MENENDEIRVADEYIEDILIENEQDEFLRFAIQESLNEYNRQKKFEEQIKKLKEDNEKKQIEHQKREMERIEMKKQQFGIVIARLKLLSNNKENKIIKDITDLIEWECTSSFHIKNFRPKLKNEMKIIIEWIKNNLNQSLQNILLNEITMIKNYIDDEFYNNDEENTIII